MRSRELSGVKRALSRAEENQLWLWGGRESGFHCCCPILWSMEGFRHMEHFIWGNWYRYGNGDQRRGNKQYTDRQWIGYSFSGPWCKGYDHCCFSGWDTDHRKEWELLHEALRRYFDTAANVWRTQVGQL